jgi:tape measure domain-containing protein
VIILATVAELLVKIGAESSGLRKELASTQRQMKRAFGPEALAASGKAAGLLGMLSAAMGAVGGASVIMAGKMAASRVAFDTLLGDTQKAKAFLEDLYQFAAETPFEFEGLQDTAKKLLAFKFAAEDIIPMMTAIGDAAGMLGSGQEGIDRMTLALSQMQSKGKVQSQEMLQLAEAGVNAWQYLANSMGMSISEVMDKVSKGEVDAQTGINAIVMGMQRDFAGGMSKQAKEIPGLWSTVMDNTKMVLTSAGDGLIKALGIKEKLSGLAGYLSQFAGYVKSNGLGQALRDMIPNELSSTIFILAGAITAAAIPAMVKFALSTWAAIAPLLPFIAMGAAVGAMAWLIWKNWEPLSDLFSGLWQTISNAVKWYFNGVKADIFRVLSAIVGGVDKLFKALGVKSSVEGMLNNINAALQDATANMDDARKNMTSGVDKMGGSFEKFGVNTKKAFEEITDGAKKLNTVFTGLKGGSDFGGGEDAEKLEDLKKKAEQVSEQIRQEWVQTTKTQLEQLDIWKNEQIKTLDETRAANENYQRDLERVEATYSERRKKILEDENAHQEALDEARKQGKIAAFADELEQERALLAADLTSRQEMIDLYYELWQETHRTSMSYMAEAMSGLYSGLTEFFADIINNAKSIGDAWDSLKSKFLTMLGQMVAQWLASRLMMWAMEKMFGKKQQSQTSTQAASTAMSWAPAAAMASLASFGGNAAPAMMGIAMTTGLAMGLAALPALAEGGITTGPTIAEIGEGRYKEAVLPLNKRAFEKVGLAGDRELTTFAPIIQLQFLDTKDADHWLENGGGARIERYLKKAHREFAFSGV